MAMGGEVLAGGGELRHEPAFLEPARADALFGRLRDEIAWEQRSVRVFGRLHPQPRLVRWIADFPYTYSGTTLPACPWPEWLAALRDEVEAAVCGAAAGRFDGVLLNYYRDGRDSMGLHSDDEPEIVPASPIASLSLGAARRFRLRPRRERLAADGFTGPVADVELRLQHGSLLVMAGTLQRYWRHEVPKEPRVRDGRINLTFRMHLREPGRGIEPR